MVVDRDEREMHRALRRVLGEEIARVLRESAIDGQRPAVEVQPSEVGPMGGESERLVVNAGRWRFVINVYAYGVMADDETG